MNGALSTTRWQHQGAWGRAEVVCTVGETAGGWFAEEALDWRYYAAVEEGLHEGFAYRYAVLTSPDGREQAVQPFFLVEQEIFAGLPEWLRLPLRLRMLMVGCAAGEGRPAGAAPWVVQALAGALEAQAQAEGARLVVLKEVPGQWRAALEKLEGYRRVPSFPAAALRLDFTDFESYMATRLSRAYRKGLRRKFRECERQGGVEMEVLCELGPHLKAVYPLYCQTWARSRYRFERLTPEYFLALERWLPDRVRFFLWRHKGRVVAFAACVVHEGVLHDLVVGLEYEVALELHLYFVTWRGLVEWALREGLHTYRTGPLNYDPKQHLRMRLEPLDLYVRPRFPLVGGWLGAALPLLAPARYDPVLRRFPNVGELF